MTSDTTSSSIGNDSRLQDTCSHIVVSETSRGQRCHAKRSCRSCLERSGCQIDEYGWCHKEDSPPYTYMSDLDYRKALNKSLVLPESNLGDASALKSEQHWRFRSRDVAYCAADDAMCRSCVEAKFWMPNSLSRPDSRFCMGAGGCVCIANCELSDPTLPPFGDYRFDCEPPVVVTPPSEAPSEAPSLPWTPTKGGSGALLSSVLIAAAAVVILIGLAVSAHVCHNG